MYLKQKKLDDEWWELAYKIEAESNVRWGKVINDLYKEVESSNSKEEANSKIQLANELQEMMNVYNTKFQTLSNNYYSLPSNNKNNQILPA